jgi:hypothetical protein
MDSRVRGACRSFDNVTDFAGTASESFTQHPAAGHRFDGTFTAGGSTTTLAT